MNLINFLRPNSQNENREVLDIEGENRMDFDPNPEVKEEEIERFPGNNQNTEDSLIFRQWYEKYEERYDLENNLMKEEFPEFEGKILADSRLSFSGDIMDIEVLIICGYLYPLQPPEAYILSEKIKSNIIGHDGRVDLFLTGGFEWVSNNHYVSDLAKYLRNMISILMSSEIDEVKNE